MDNNLINDFKRSTIMSAIALHDFSVKHYDHKGWVQYCVEIMNNYGLTPTRMGISAPSIKSDQMRTYIREVKKLDKIDTNSITSISLQATIHASDDSWKDDIFQCDFSNSIRREASFVLTCCDDVHHLLKNEINNITKKLSEYFKPEYGYHYKREYKKGPTCYPHGIIMGLERGEKERENINLWNAKFKINNDYNTGDLRDIYPMNLIVKEHLNREVSPKTTFHQFITSNPLHGTLEPLDEQRFAWWVENENIPLVRDCLRPSGIIIAG
jgi:hypothetical protein